MRSKACRRWSALFCCRYMAGMRRYVSMGMRTFCWVVTKPPQCSVQSNNHSPTLPTLQKTGNKKTTPSPCSYALLNEAVKTVLVPDYKNSMNDLPSSSSTWSSSGLVKRLSNFCYAFLLGKRPTHRSVNNGLCETIQGCIAVFQIIWWHRVP